MGRLMRTGRQRMLSRLMWRQVKRGSAVAGALGLMVSGVALTSLSPAMATAKPLAGRHRMVHTLRQSGFAKSPAHLRGPRRATPGRAPATVPPARLPAVRRAERAAVTRARATRRPVLVGAETTATTAVYAHPSGLMSFSSNVYPVRARVNGVWKPIDTRLRPGGSGMWRVAVTNMPLAFSGGGFGPLVTLADPASGGQVSVYWPARLPRPAVSGSVALYRNVLAGVDLRMEATSAGYSEVLVVRGAAAASRLRSLSLRVGVSGGLLLRRGPDGSLGVVERATGKLLFVSGRPVMWDSSRSRHFAIRPSADNPGSGRITPVPVSYRTGGASATIRLAPWASALAGKGVAYPLYIDPEFNPNTNYYAEVMITNSGSYKQSWNTTSGTTSVGSGIVEVGDCGYSNCYWYANGNTYLGYKDRDYFRFPTTDLKLRNGASAKIYKVSFDIYEEGNSAGCTSERNDIYSTTGGISSSTSWGGPQGSLIAYQSSDKGGGSSCPAGSVDFTNTDSGSSGLLSTLQTAANNGASTVTLELRADSETNELQYKTYKDNPTLTVYYNYAPLTPTGLSVQNQVTCTSTTYTSLEQPHLYATGTDNNPSPLKITLNYTLQTSGGSAAGGTLASPTGSSGSQQYTTPSTALTDGAYQFHASATNNPTDSYSAKRTSAASAWYPFTVMSTPPSAAPTIQSFDYPKGQWGQATGVPGVFTVGTNGASNIAGFAYDFDGGAGAEPVPTTSDCGYTSHGGLGTSIDSSGNPTASGEFQLVQGSTGQIIAPSSLTAGTHTLYVVSFDDAHNVSAESAYTFYVAPNYQVASQPGTYIDGSSLVASASGPNASLVVAQSDCCGMLWRGGSQLIFNGNASGQSFTVNFSVPDSGWWQFGGDLTKAKDYGQAQLTLDQATSDTDLGGTSKVPWDGYSPVVTTAYLDFGALYLASGTHTLTFTMVGTNPNTTGNRYKAGINYLTLMPTNRYEGESLSYGTPTAGSLAVQYLASTSLSDHAHLMLTNTSQGARFTVDFNAPVESDYALGVNLTTADDYGELQFNLDPATSNINLDGTAATPIDAYSPSVSTEYVFLGGVHLTAGQHVLQVTVTGTDASSINNRYNAGIDYLEAVPVTGATDANFTQAMNNLGIATDNAASFGGNFDMTNSSTGGNLSLNAMHSAGITPGTASAAGATFNVNGATFTMPALRASSGTVVDDNVIPDGQKIPLPQVQATDVAMLVATTCGGANGSPAMNATLTYSNGSSSQPLIPSVPDWTTGLTGDAGVVLSHWDTGTSPGTRQPRIYEVILPANPTATLSSITLPVMPVNFLTDTHSCTTSQGVLHILAIGTRTVAQGSDGLSGAVWTGGYSGPMDAAITPAGGSYSNETLREVVPTTVTGSGDVRVRLSNEHAATPVTFSAVTIGAQSSGPATEATPVQLTFGASNSTSVTIPAGGDVYSNPVARPAAGTGTGALTVSMYIPSTDTVTTVPMHETLNAATYYAGGADDTGNQDGTTFSSANSLQGLYYLAGIDVSDATTTDGTIAVLGDQTATAAPAWTFNSWSTDLPSALSADGVALPGAIANVSNNGLIPEHWWRMNGTGLDTATTAYDSGSGATSNLTLGGTASWTTDNPKTGVSAGALSLDGSSGYASTSGQAMDTTTSFTVSAWVKLSSLPTHNATVIAVDGTTNSPFYLAYNYSAGGKWDFYFPSTDATGPSWASAVGPVAAAGVWTHLAGVYDASTNTAQLYVNGTQVASTTVTPWSATGPLTVGRSRYNGSPADYFPGEISDVRVYNSKLWGTGVSEVYNDNGTGSVTTSEALTVFRHDVTEQPNVRDVIVSLGANDVLEGTTAAAIESNLSQLVTAIQGYYVDNDPSTPSVQVILTTIPPLGLPASDPREQAREAVNTWIMGNNTSAQVYSDIASAVADPSNQNDINPSLFSGGVPTDSYYSTIANQIASDLNNAIPIYINGL